jgi:sugar-specific transcriptional regulator TrmB
MNSISPQAAQIYRLLITAKRLTAKEIAAKLNILAPAVHRSADKLAAMGLIERHGSHPTQFQALPPQNAADTYLVFQRQWFLNQFPQVVQNNAHPLLNDLAVSYIKNKAQLYSAYLRDEYQVKKDISLIVSGLEATPEVILANKHALDRGVRIRILVQEISDREMLTNWEKMGIEVKITSPIQTRLLLLDKNIAYLVSYDQANPDLAIGVRFAYPPIAHILQGIFEQKWKTAESPIR